MSLTTTSELLKRKSILEENPTESPEIQKSSEFPESQALHELSNLANIQPSIPPWRQGGIDVNDFILSHKLSYAQGKIIELLCSYQYAGNPIQILESAKYNILLLIEEEKGKDPYYKRPKRLRRQALTRGRQQDRETIPGIKDKDD